MVVPTTIFPDTMILIHYQPKQLPWADLVGDTSVEIKVAPRVTSEIDKHKESSNGQQRRRALAAQKLLLECDGKELVQGVPCELLPFEPPEFTELGLNPRVPDDRILASVLHYKQTHPRQRVVLLTADLGQQTKAKHLGLEFVFVGVEYRAPHEEDPEVGALKRENAELRKQMGPQPELSLAFVNEEAHLTVQVHSKPYSQERVDAHFEAERQLAEGKIPGLSLRIRLLPFERLPSEKDLTAYYERLKRDCQRFCG